MGATIKSLLLIFMLLNGSVVSASALMDICCDIDDRASTRYAPLSDETEVHIAHCCHAGGHFSALYQINHLDNSRVQIVWPTTAATDAALLTEAPPVPPPNV